LLLAPGGLEEARARVEEGEPPKLAAITGMAEASEEAEASSEHTEPSEDEGPESHEAYESEVEYPPASMEG
jgi:hypothetical protein